MSASRPRLVVTLPGRTVDALPPEIEAARAAGADLAEVRVDRMAPTERARLPVLFPAALPLLATFRSRVEGGEGDDDPALRRRELERLAALPFRAIDVETARDAIDGPFGPETVRSSHLAASASLEEIDRHFRGPAPPRGFVKVVVPSSVARWLFELAPRVAPADVGDAVVLATGPAGALSRVAAVRRGAPAVFCAPGRDRPPPDELEPVEPSQIPVDRLARYRDAGARGPLFALVGRPVAHSRSPDVHAGWMAEDGRDGLYLPLELDDDRELARVLPTLARLGFAGINVTHPFKTAALSAATRVERAAEVVGVANCLTLADDEIEAQNTDLAAILRRLGEIRASGSWDGRNLAVVGSGGAARATLAAARELGAAARVYARRGMVASELARAFGAAAGQPSDPPVPLVVHATSVGHAEAGTLEVPLEPRLASGGLVLDWVYGAENTEVRVRTEARGGRYEDGRRLLVYQAAESYAIWWGEPPGPDSIERAIARWT